MGSVFLGCSPDNRPVAVKVIRPELSSDPEFRARFRSEVRRARRVPAFCTAEVIDADPDHEPPYLVVEYVAGPSLAEIVSDHGPLSGGNLHSAAIGVTTALAAIHDAGIVHRDLKPANVLFGPMSIPKVIDFGIAKALDTTQQHTMPGQILGTIAYMGPERFDARAAKVGTAADIFAWGAVVTFAATGHTPFAPDALAATASGIALPAPDLTGLPPVLRELVARALNEEPDRRPSAQELLEQLIRAGDPVIRSSLADRPALRKATAAVRHTVVLRPRRTRRLKVAAAVLAAGLVAYPAIRQPDTPGGAGQPPATATTQSSLGDRDQEKPASRANRTQKCSLAGPLEMTPAQPRAFTCPAAGATDQTIHVRVRPAADACAAIRTHVAGDRAYRITVCADHVALDSEGGPRPRRIVYAAFDPGSWHRVDIITPGTGLTVSIDGEPLIVRPRLAPQLPRGAVVLDAVAPVGGRPATGAVTFADFTVESTS
jgi:hypothetical protein